MLGKSFVASFSPHPERSVAELRIKTEMVFVEFMSELFVNYLNSLNPLKKQIICGSESAAPGLYSGLATIIPVADLLLSRYSSSVSSESTTFSANDEACNR